MWILAFDSSIITFVVIVLISAVANWLQNRREQAAPPDLDLDTEDVPFDRERTGSESDRRAVSQPGRSSSDRSREPRQAPESWEGELRRILTGNREPTNDPSETAPPAVPGERRTRPATPPRIPTGPAPAFEPKPRPKPRPTPTPRQMAGPVRRPAPEQATTVSNTASAAARALENAERQARRLHDEVAKRVRKIENAASLRAPAPAMQVHRLTGAASGRRGRSTAPAGTVGGLRSRAGARQAVIASVILAPPKALYDEPLTRPISG